MSANRAERFRIAGWTLAIVALAFAVGFPSFVYANSTSVESGGTQYVPRLKTTDATAAISSITLPLSTSICWSNGGVDCAGSNTINFGAANAFRMNAGSVNFGTSGEVSWSPGGGFQAIAQSAKLDLAQTQSGIPSRFYNNTGASGTAVVVGASTADATAGVAAVTLLAVQTAVTGTPVSKFSVFGDGSATLVGPLTSSVASGSAAIRLTTGAYLCFDGVACTKNIRYDTVQNKVGGLTNFDNGLGASDTITSTKASGNNAIALTIDGARLDLGTGSNDYFISNGTSISTPAYVASATPDTILTVSTGLGAGTLLATGTVYAGHKISNAFTVTNVSLYVSVASSATASGTEIITVTDGTNTCTATFACDTVTNTTGVKDVATANGAGTGCVYAASALLTFSTTNQGCGTAATVKNIDVIGKWQ